MEQNFSITGHTGLTGLLGSPVAHSLSPLMHNEAFRQLGLDYVYLCFDVKEEKLETAVRGLTACGIRGFNLTMPDKNRMAELADEIVSRPRPSSELSTRSSMKTAGSSATIPTESASCALWPMPGCLYGALP